MCDEIVVIAHGKGETPELFRGAADAIRQSEEEGRRCEVRIRTIHEPPLIGFGGYASYLMYGICLASEPDWILAVEADYMISPAEAGKLRKVLLESTPDAELVMARAVNLNYDGTRKFYSPDFKNWFTPHDGYAWDRPIGCRPSLGIYPCTFNGIARDNAQINCEGFISLRPGRWGDSFNSKFMNHNPYGFNIIRTNVQFEHLQFTRFPQSLIAKISQQYWISCKAGIGHVLNGDEPYDLEYKELTEVRPSYLDHIEALRVLAG